MYTPEEINTLLLSATGLVVAATALLVAAKTWWEVCKVHLVVLKEARSQIAKHAKINERLEKGETKTADLEAAQTVQRVEQEQTEIEYQKLTNEGR